MAGFLREERIEHQLAAHYGALRRIRRRRTLLASPLWAEIGAEVERVCAAVETAHAATVRPRPIAGLRLCAWNLERGRRLDEIERALTGDPRLRADLYLLVEVDSGMARSGNRNVARALAEALGASYAFAPSYLALADDTGENPERLENGLALAGVAIVSRLPLRAARGLDLPPLRDKFSSREKRLGQKRALAVCVDTSDGPLLAAACHLDSNASPRQRARQLDALLSQLDGPAVLGGDLNTTTYDLASPLRLAYNVLHKLLVTGFRETIGHYMHPETFYERALFETLGRHGFSVDGWNDRAAPTTRYDLNGSYAVAKTREAVGGPLTSLLRWKLRPWNGSVPARLDWFAGRGLRARRAEVVEVPGASDHFPIVVELAGPSPP